MVENKQVHACKGKNLAQEFDASGALDGQMKFRGQSNCETLNNCTIVEVGLQQPLVVANVSSCKVYMLKWVSLFILVNGYIAYLWFVVL